MSGNSWHITHPPPPRIRAVIKNDLWNVTSDTFGDSSLTVFQNTFLTLVCIAVYPVFWRKGQERLSHQWQQSCSSYQGNQTCWNSSADSFPLYAYTHTMTVPIDKEYHANITFKATPDMQGNYDCYGTRVQLGTSVVVRIEQKINYSRPQLLQAGFDEVLILSDVPWQWPEFISFIYFTPRKSVNNMLTMQAYGGGDNQCDLSLSIPPFASRDLTLHVVEAIYDYQFALLTFSTSCRGYRTEGYRISVNDDSGRVVQTKDFVFRKLDLSSDGISAPSSYRGNTYSIVLTTGRLYSIQYTTQREKGGKALLAVDEMGPVYSRTAPCTNIPDENHERRRREESAASAERCGLIVATTGTGNGEKFGEQATLLIVNATRPCAFTIDFESEGLGDYGTILLVAVADKNIFGSNDAGLLVRSKPASDTHSIEIYVNQSFELQCLFPVCQLGGQVWCCQSVDNNCRWEKDVPEGRLLEHLPSEPNITVDRFGLYTTAISMTITQIQKSQQGSYACAFKKSPSDDISFPHSADTPRTTCSLYVKVIDPEEPSFTDHKGPGPFIRPLSLNDTTTLDCSVTAHPQPNISWSCSPEETQIQCRVGTASNLVVSQPGNYTCTATNGYGLPIQRTYEVQEYAQAPTPAPQTPSTGPLLFSIFIIAPVLLCALFAIIILLLMERRRRNKRLDGYFKELADLLNTAQETFHIDNASPLNDQASLLPYNINFEIDRSSFVIKGKLLGHGEFGYIYKGEVNFPSESLGVTETIPVAVKIPKDPSNHYHHRALLDELKILCHIRPHPNVLVLMGACTTAIEKRQLFILTEFCEHGSLKNYLIENRWYLEALEEEHKSVQTLLSYAYQAANGMVHLAAENIIHRDLALRNLLLTNANIVKISDFGMSRKHDSIYHRPLSPDVPIPLFWMALESLLSDQYTQKSDVWSFGIVLWELFNCGRRPYPDHEPDIAFRSWLRASEQNRLGPPKIVCEAMYHLMRDCWKVDPSARPTFSQCKRQIEETLEMKSPSMYISLVRNLSDASVNMALARRGLSARTNRVESRSPHISDIDMGTSESLDEDSNGQYSMVMNETQVNEDNSQPPDGPGMSTDIELYVVRDAPERKAKPYVAASLT